MKASVPQPTHGDSSQKTAPIKIGMILDQPFPPDARVEREATALVEAGFEVFLLCELSQETSRSQLTQETYEGIRLHRADPTQVIYTVPGLNIKTRLPYRGILKNLNHFFWNLDPTWHQLIDEFVTTTQVDILHVHDLRLVSTALAVAERYALPVVADLHENYPALMAMLKGKVDPQRGEKARKKWDRIETYCTWQADRVITVCEEARERLIAKGVRPNKITVIPNTVDITKFQPSPPKNNKNKVDESTSPHQAIRDKHPDDFLLTYVGFINSDHRGIHTVIDAMGLLKKEIPNLKLLAAGGYREPYLARLKGLIQAHELEDRVVFTGWLDEKDFVPYIEASDICLCPHLANEHTHTTFPNKVYLYHLFGKPIIASSCKPLVRYIDATQGGITFEAGDSKSLSHAIKTLYKDDKKRKKLGEAGHQAVIQTHHWQKSAASLVKLYRDLIHQQQKSHVPVGI